MAHDRAREKKRRGEADSEAEPQAAAEAAERAEGDDAAAEGEGEGEAASAEGDEPAAFDEGIGSDEPGDEPKEASTVREWLAGGRLSREMSLLFGLILPAMLLAANLWQVRAFTVDDSYISFRYARNLARGLGLVYNEGERIEGYTNFLWTVILAGGIKVGIDPVTFAKVLGAACSFGSLGLTWLIARRLAPYRTVPCIATWLCASTIVFSGYAVFGLETALFVLLLLAGTLLFLRETGGLLGDRAGEPGGRRDGPYRAPVEPRGAERGAPVEPSGIPWSGLAFGLAGLTRPEAPMFIGIFMLMLGRRFFGKQNLLRAALFVAPVLAHVAFRHSYYGTWLPNTLSAKTGNLQGQVTAGAGYVQNYLNHAGAIVWLGFVGLAIGVVRRRRDLLAMGAIAFAVIGYVVLVGGDWMPFFRFMAPFEPFCFLLVDVGARSIADRRDRTASLALAAFVIAMVAHRGGSLRDAQAQFLNKEKRFWDNAAGGTVRWLKQNGVPGEIAVGDIGYIGYETDYPLLDLLGLVDPVISKLPGGYTQKLGPGFADRFFSKLPMYALIISSNTDCQHPSVPGSQVLYRDRRFSSKYSLGGRVNLDGGFAWCIYKRRDAQ